MVHSVRMSIALLACLAAAAVSAWAVAHQPPAPQSADPAAWGGDHVGKAFPAYVTGDECLFCHRRIGSTWSDNRHQQTVRPADPDDEAMQALRQHDPAAAMAEDVRFLSGSRRVTRFLKRSAAYGKLELLTTRFIPDVGSGDGEAPATGGGRLQHAADRPSWQPDAFANRCAGCHATAVDARTGAFSAISLDCFVCHGDVPLGHTKDISLVLLSAKNKPPREVVSTCGQCHLRGGKSRSNGRPYPNTFVAGDNLFRDFRVDLSDAAIRKLPVVQRHVFLSARDVALRGKSESSCLACHDVHQSSTEKHPQLASRAICASCHEPGTGETQLLKELARDGRRQGHSHVCDY